MTSEAFDEIDAVLATMTEQTNLNNEFDDIDKILRTANIIDDIDASANNNTNSSQQTPTKKNDSSSLAKSSSSSSKSSSSGGGSPSTQSSEPIEINIEDFLIGSLLNASANEVAPGAFFLSRRKIFVCLKTNRVPFLHSSLHS